MEQEVTKIFGLRAILEAINSGQEIEKVYIQKEIQGTLAKALQHSINENKPPEVTGQDGINTLQALLTIYETR